MNVTPTHVYFWNGIFSNWHPTPFIYNGVEYNCSEQYMMQQKAIVFGDKERELEIMEARTPDVQKYLGRLVIGFTAEKWAPVCEDLMVPALVAKFTSTEDLKREMLATNKRVLVEASPYDTIWGVGLGENDPRILDERNWKGQNLLGKVLMRARDIIKENA